ncbi:MAG: hypothetical protein AMJ75_00145 [Phycisphaerae bacterium SM1_79]|nr:MAG: hypothetical protein AMJ75_00145 [Phycisphaerae bacterium SM1_79]
MARRVTFRVPTILIVLLLFLAQAHTVEWTTVAGEQGAGAVITGESPECWSSPTALYVESPVSFSISSITYSDLGQATGGFGRGTGNGMIRNWILRGDNTTEGRWVLDMRGAGVISFNPIGTCTCQARQLSSSCTGTAIYTLVPTTSYSGYALYVTGTIDGHLATDTREISFADPNCRHDNGTWDIILTGDFCGTDFGLSDGYVDVWDLMRFGDHCHMHMGDSNWDTKFDLTAPDAEDIGGYVDVWELMIFAHNWHKGQKP